MSRVDAWLTNSFPLGAWVDDHDLGVDTAILISDKPTSITVVRAGSSLAAQTVRIETLGGDRKVQTAGGVVHQIDALVLGYKGHPTITNTDLQPGDRFKLEGRMFEVIALMPGLVDSLQALCSVKG